MGVASSSSSASSASASASSISLVGIALLPPTFTLEQDTRPPEPQLITTDSVVTMAEETFPAPSMGSYSMHATSFSSGVR